jgi:hypothetical protein
MQYIKYLESGFIHSLSKKKLYHFLSIQLANPLLLGRDSNMLVVLLSSLG